MSGRKVAQGFGANENDRHAEVQPVAEPPTATGSNLDALQAHQGYESIAGALVRSSDSRLNTLAGSLVEARKPQVRRFVDFLEKAETGELDLALIGAELQRRQERKADAPVQFNLDSPGFGIDLDQTVDCTTLITGFSTAKAIAGV